MPGQVRIRLSSMLQVELEDGVRTGRELGSRKARTLLALLAAERGRAVSLDRIVDALWATAPPRDPAANVATMVSRTRKLLGESALVVGTRAYRIAPELCSLDLDEAAVLAREANRRAAAGQPALAAAAAREALALLGNGMALPDEQDADWVVGVRQEADELRRRARHLLAGATAMAEPSEAKAVSTEAVSADPYDERAVQDLMRALVLTGSVGSALAAYDDLAARLREDLGVDPGPRTSELHLAILRGETLDAPYDEQPSDRQRSERQPSGRQGSGTPTSEAGRSMLVGRSGELEALDRLWADAGAGRGALVLLEGEGGIGKTALLDTVAETARGSGGQVLRGRCHPAERSLFLQPFVDALRPVLLRLGTAELSRLLGEHANPWVVMIPQLGTLLPADQGPPATPAVERRRAFDAVAAVLRRLASRRPVLLIVDDLQDAGAASVDLLAYLAGQLAPEPVLLVGAVRSEAVSTLDRLAGRGVRLTLGALAPAAVEQLASAAGLGDRAGEVMTRTRGHPLSVVEFLRVLATGAAGVPVSLAEAVQARTARLEPQARELVEAASVLRSRLDPRLLAVLLGIDEIATARLCEEVSRSGLLHRVGAHYELANDLLQECVYASLGPALSAAYHRRAADLLSDQPEAMARHAFAAGEPQRAAQGWLLAAEAAMARSAVEDAVALLDRADAVAEDAALRARILLARAGAHEAATSWVPALNDIDEALDLARRSADRRLEMAALRARGGDVPSALRRPMAELRTHLEKGLRLATGLGDRTAEADLTTRLTVLDASRLHLAPALERAEASLARSRESSSAREAVPLALDGVKTVLGYLGEATRLREVAAELVPLLRERRSLWLLQWAVFESSYAAAAEGGWDEARALVGEALAINQLTGFGAYTGYYRAHLGWYERLTGDLDAARSLGRAALEETSPVDHPWWYAAASGLLAGTLLELGNAAEAADVARRGLEVAGPEAPEAWRLRCLAPLAAAHRAPGQADPYAAALNLLDAVDCPPGRAWVVGADCYLLVARAARWRGDEATAARTLAPLRLAVNGTWRPVRERVEQELGQISSATSAAARAAPPSGTGT